MCETILRYAVCWVRVTLSDDSCRSPGRLRLCKFCQPFELAHRWLLSKLQRFQATERYQRQICGNAQLFDIAVVPAGMPREMHHGAVHQLSHQHASSLHQACNRTWTLQNTDSCRDASAQLAATRRENAVDLALPANLHSAPEPQTCKAAPIWWQPAPCKRMAPHHDSVAEAPLLLPSSATSSRSDSISVQSHSAVSSGGSCGLLQHGGGQPPHADFRPNRDGIDGWMLYRIVLCFVLSGTRAALFHPSIRHVGTGWPAVGGESAGRLPGTAACNSCRNTQAQHQAGWVTGWRPAGSQLSAASAAGAPGHGMRCSTAACLRQEVQHSDARPLRQRSEQGSACQPGRAQSLFHSTPMAAESVKRKRRAKIKKHKWKKRKKLLRRKSKISQGGSR